MSIVGDQRGSWWNGTAAATVDTGNEKQRARKQLEVLHTTVVDGWIVVVAKHKGKPVVLRVDPIEDEVTRYHDLDIDVMREAIMALDAHETQEALDDDKPDEADSAGEDPLEAFRRAVQATPETKPPQGVLDALRYGQGLSQFDEQVHIGVDLAKDSYTDQS